MQIYIFNYPLRFSHRYSSGIYTLPHWKKYISYLSGSVQVPHTQRRIPSTSLRIRKDNRVYISI